MDMKNELILAYGKENKLMTLSRLKEIIDNIDEHEDELIDSVKDRLFERYIEPFERLIEIEDTPSMHGSESDSTTDKLRLGFSIMASMCLLIETLQSFREGWGSSDGNSGKAFKLFFSEEKHKEILGLTPEDVKKLTMPREHPYNFYENIRCGILHQGETTGGWRINNGDKVIDTGKKLIDAQKFLKAMKNILENYCKELKSNQELMAKCIVKWEAIGDNCK